MIGDDTWLPWRCFVMPGVRVGRRVIVGAQSVVNRDLPDDVVAAGIPAKVVREHSATVLTYEERHEILLRLLTEFAACHATATMHEDDQGRVVLALDGAALAVLNTESTTPTEASTLNLVWTPCAAAEHRRTRLYCIDNFHCSPWSELSDGQRDLLQSFRSQGLRAYPVDELEWVPSAR